MALSTREPLILYLRSHATILRLSSRSGSGIADAELHARALELLADHVGSLAEDDERLLVLGTLTIRGGDFTPGPGAEHALNQFVGTSTDDCERFLTQLSRIARDDGLARAREFGFLPPLIR
jgi:hypothetical protein